MNAAFMLFQRHERGIHPVSATGEVGTGLHHWSYTLTGATGATGPQAGLCLTGVVLLRVRGLGLARTARHIRQASRKGPMLSRGTTGAGRAPFRSPGPGPA